MSRLSSFDPLVAQDIQRCRSQIKNILDFGINTRKENIKQSLDDLDAIPDWWARKVPKLRSRRMTSSTLATSFSAAEFDRSGRLGD